MAYNETIKLANSENEIINPATSDELQLIKEALRMLSKPLAQLSIANRLQIELSSATINLPVIVQNASIPTTVTNIGGLGAFESQYLGGRLAYANVVRANITF